MTEGRDRKQKSCGELVERFLGDTKNLPCVNGISRMRPKYIQKARTAYGIPWTERILYTFQANPADNMHITPEQRFYFTERGFYGRVASLGGGNLFLPWEEFVNVQISEPPWIKRLSGMVLCFGNTPVGCMWMAWPFREKVREWMNFYHSLQNYLREHMDEEAEEPDRKEPAHSGEIRTGREHGGTAQGYGYSQGGMPPGQKQISGGILPERGRTLDRMRFGRELRPGRKGHLTIPEGREEIRAREFEGRKDLVSVTVPGTVKRIDVRAFADCVNLREIQLQEGVQILENNVFNGCRALRQVTLPASVREVTGWTFYSSGLAEPVYSRSGEILVYCPEEAAGEFYTVPEGVKEIGTQAFYYQPKLAGVALPSGLEAIRNRAFIECGISRMELPDSVRLLEKDAFLGCRNLTEICWNRETDELDRAVRLCWVKGDEFLRRRAVSYRGQPYWRESSFRETARRCAQKDAAAMEEMAEFFHRQASGEGQREFFEAAEWFWKFRAYQYGSEKAKEAVRGWLKEHPGERPVSLFLSENLHGGGTGCGLNALGLLFFAEDRSYTLRGMDENGIVLASSYESEDGPDEDGFGMETYYDWWYLDECLNPIPGAERIHSYSNFDRNASYGQKLFSETYEAALKELRRRGESSG